MKAASSELVQHYLDIIQNSPYSWYIASGVVVTAWAFRSWLKQLPIPTYGGFFSFSRTISAIQFQVTSGPQRYIEWYQKVPMILVPRMDTWTILVHGKYIDELSRAPEDQLSFVDASSNIFQTRYNFGQWVFEDHFHHEPIKKQLTRNLSTLFPDVLDEVHEAISSQLRIGPNESATVAVFPFIQRTIARTANRVFVGLPLCRDEGWLALVQGTALDTIKVATVVNMFPEFLRPIVGRLMSPMEPRLAKALKMAGPLVEEKIAQRGTEAQTEDYISWLIQYATDRECNAKNILNRLMITNFAAIHTSSSTVTQALYWLLSRPHYFEPLRAEILEVTERLGWTREAIGSMPKLDSFMKESMRMTPIGPQIMNRIALRPFTFSNGLKVPTGTSISSHLYGTHQDEILYPHASTFDGFRFAESTTGEKDETGARSAPKTKKTMYTTSSTYLSFGHGKHACPGRFFASMVVKLIMAELIVNYDLSWPEDVPKNTGGVDILGEKVGYRPADMWIGGIVPDQRAKVVLRRKA
ncbi:hypothetical protein M408DRAFT_332825 [Serendipita vermifera MAFF 305830]|uniref:Cytochrome P450 n=1 Tax=Serendipita vermifera MAFF 305830 TaxID=933852 RepID=A0A0C2W8A1_SERVB|nr:hypothetical protein M408DRAFT_332825 [Serendipita vermifera MAFF 305830]